MQLLLIHKFVSKNNIPVKRKVGQLAFQLQWEQSQGWVSSSVHPQVLGLKICIFFNTRRTVHSLRNTPSCGRANICILLRAFSWILLNFKLSPGVSHRETLNVLGTNRKWNSFQPLLRFVSSCFDPILKGWLNLERSYVSHTHKKTNFECWCTGCESTNKHLQNHCFQRKNVCYSNRTSCWIWKASEEKRKNKKPKLKRSCWRGAAEYQPCFRKVRPSSSATTKNSSAAVYG